MSVSIFTIALLMAGTATADESNAPETPAAEVTATAETSSAPATAASPPAPLALPVLTPAPHPVDHDTADDAIIVTGKDRRPTRTDPLVGINAASYEAVQVIDKAVVAPTAKTYERIVPKPVRNGLRNVLINLAEPIVFINYLLQFKPGKAAETAGRFALNSTIGVAGLFDMAKRKPFHLPYRQNGFANTMGYHGIKPGPFLFVPILGPTTVRDLVGRFLDLGLIPAVAGKPFNRPIYGLTTGIVKSMNDRVEFDEQIKTVRQSSDPYIASRDLYLKRRQAEIDALHGPKSGLTAPSGMISPVTSVPTPTIVSTPEVAPAPVTPTPGQ